MGNDCVKANQEDIGMNSKQGTGASNQAAVGASIDDQILSGAPMDALKQKVGLTFECQNLPNLDKGSKTDPFVVLWQMNGKQKQKIGQTELIMDNLNPVFVTTVNMDYFFESQQVMIADVYDCDDATTLNNLQKQDFIGSFEFQLGKLVSSRNQQILGDLANPTRKQSGKLQITAEEKKADYGKTVASFVASAQGQKLQGTCFIVINKQNKNGQFKPVFKSETKGNLNGSYTFNHITIDTDTLADANNDQQIQVQIYKHNPNGNHTKLGTGVFTLSNMIDSGGAHTIDIPQCGKVSFTKFKIEERVTFLDYVFGGCEIGVHVAVDYTMSNGNYGSPNSLHYLNQQRRNGYTDAINACLNILQNYDNDKRFPIYGFGGKLPGDSKASHCFALNGNILNPEVDGVNGALNAYYQSINKVALYGGTEFSSILNYVNGFANQNAMEMTQFNQKYTICLILTDGVINDLDRTIDEVIKGSLLPISIIIVGIGLADFDQMEQLDGDTAPLFSRTLQKYAQRDIVQFVPFRDVKNDPSRLTKMVLNEVPRQLTSYFGAVGIKPNPPRRDINAEINNAMSGKLAGMMQPNMQEGFFFLEKQKIMGQLQSRGWDPIQVANFLDHVGVANLDVEKVDAAMRQPGYVNPMTIQ